MKKISLCYERYMEEYSFVDDHKGMGKGTLFRGDSGYVTTYDGLVSRIKYDINEVV